MFIDKFVDAIRFEMARSAEKAYLSLALKDVVQMFLLKDQGELDAFVRENNGKEGVEWVVRGDRLWFQSEKSEQKVIPAERMIRQTLEYATELNRII